MIGLHAKRHFGQVRPDRPTENFEIAENLTLWEQLANILGRMRAIVRLAGVFSFGVVLQQGLPQTSEPPLQVSLCEVKAHPENFLHKLIEVHVTASHGFEDSMVDDRRCPWPKAGPGVWMEYGGMRSSNTMYAGGGSPKPERDRLPVVEGMPVDLVDDQTFKEFDSQLHSQHSKPIRGSNTVRATIRGRLFGRFEGIAGTQVNTAWRGYGHMDCCILFVVTQVVSIDSTL